MWNHSTDCVITVRAMFSISCVSHDVATVSYIYITTFVANTGKVFHAILICIYIVLHRYYPTVSIVTISVIFVKVIPVTWNQQSIYISKRLVIAWN